MRILISLFLILFSLQSWGAKNYGRIRVLVQETNSAHNEPVTLATPRKVFGNFSHATKELIFAVTDTHLDRYNPNTEVSADYQRVKAGCEFSFELYYTLNSDSWIHIGTFRAPFQASRFTIPLGMCNGVICSSDGAIQAKLEKQLIRERKIRLTEAQNQVLQAKNSALTEKIKFNIPARQEDALKPREAGDQKVADKSQQAEQNLKDIASSATLAEAGPALTEQQLLQESNAALAAEQVQNLDGALSPEAQDFGQSIAQKEVIADLSNEAARLKQEAKQGPLDKVGQTLESLTATDAARFLVTHSDLLQEAISMAIRITPLGDVIDACEATTGVENCLPGGRKLGTADRIYAGLGVAMGNRAIWSGVSKGIKKGVEAGTALVRTKKAARLLESVGAYDVRRVRSAAIGNLDFIQPAYKLGTDIIDAITKETKTFIRVFSDEGLLKGRWVAEIDDIAGKSPQEIKAFLNLEHVPTHFTYVKVEANSTIEMSIVGANEWGKREGAAQYRLLDKLDNNPKITFGNATPLKDLK